MLSFVYLGIYWNNHHHMLLLTSEVGGLVLWANLHLLFWLSLMPFTTGWMGENHFAEIPVAAYGIVLLAAAVAYFALQTAIIRSRVRVAVGCGDRPRHQGQSVAGDLLRRYRADVRQPLDRRRPLRRRRDDVADS